MIRAPKGLLVALGFFLSASAARADLSYALLVRSKPLGGRSEIRTDRVHVSGERMRVETGEGKVYIVNIATRTFWTIQPDGKTYTRASLDELEQHVKRMVPPEMLTEAPLALECVGSPRGSRGCPTGLYRVTRPDRVTWIQARGGLEGTEELETFLRGLARTTATLPVFDRVSAVQAWRDERLSGFPVRTEERLLGEGRTVWRQVSVARDIRARELDERLFLPPESARPIEFASP